MTEHIDLILEELYEIENKPIRNPSHIQSIIDFAYLIYNRSDLND